MPQYSERAKEERKEYQRQRAKEMPAIVVRVPKSIHQRFKEHCKDNARTMNQQINLYIRKALSEEFD